MGSPTWKANELVVDGRTVATVAARWPEEGGGWSWRTFDGEGRLLVSGRRDLLDDARREAQIAALGGRVVTYNSPSWGRCTGTVLSVGPDERLLVQDHHPQGAREWIDPAWVVRDEVAR